MNQDTTQKFLLWGVFLIIGICILLWLSQRRQYYCQNKCYNCDSLKELEEHRREPFSLYRYTDNCSPQYEYLSAYDGKDYYKTHPYIYPTPTNYIRALYAQ